VASNGGYIDCLKCVSNPPLSPLFLTLFHFRYALENGCPLKDDICNTVAWNGQLDSLKILHENGSQFSDESLCCAAQQGFLECLKVPSIVLGGEREERRGRENTYAHSSSPFYEVYAQKWMSME
jgi:hypothetical protein